MTTRENLLRATRFETPDYIPMIFVYNPSCWGTYPHDALLDLMESHPLLFPRFKRNEFSPPSFATQSGDTYDDEWGVTWLTGYPGMIGGIARHPLAEHFDIDRYTPPNPDNAIDWAGYKKMYAEAGSTGELKMGSLDHGHTFLRATYIRGYENVLYDMEDEEPRLMRLLEMIEAFNMTVVRRALDLGAEWMGYPEDLGMQVGPMISPALFRKYIKPIYERMMQPAREAGCVIHMHSDGDVRQLVDDLIDDGVSVMNLQDLVNGLDWIKVNLKGRVCIDLDIDRQAITTFGTPKDIDELIRTEVEALGSKEGGLMMIHGMYPGVTLENARALMDAMERYAGYYA